MRKLLSLIVCLTMGITMLMAQNRTITGRVVSEEDGEPIIGASVMLPGSSKGTITDLDGKFSLSVPSDAKTISISYVGMNTVEVPATDKMNVTLTSNRKVLDDVVVTAMGVTRSKKSLGYASQALKSEELTTGGTSSLANAIQGKLTGVDIRQSSGAPGASSQIVIRGARSFDGNNSPLYVVDGMPITTTPDFGTGNGVTGADLSDRSIDLNPDDIESINVLKGQAASALYGIRASNGVIVITTKRGKIGQSKPQVVINTNISAQTMSRKYEHQDVYAQGNFVEGFTNDKGVWQNPYSPASSMSWGPKIADLADPTVNPTYTSNRADYKGHEGMYYNPKRAAAGLDGWTKPETYDNLYDFLQTGCTENTSISISQAMKKSGYSFSLSNSHQDGIIPSTGMDRWGARGLVDWSINDQWKTGFSANYSATKITSAPGANNGIMNVLYSCPAEYNLGGIPYNAPDDPTAQILFRATSFNNPYWWAKNDEFAQHTNRMFGNGYVEFSPNIGLDGFALKIKEQAGIDMWTSDYKTIAEVGSAYNTKGEVENYGSQHNVFNNTFTVNLDGRFADDKIGVNVIVGNEVNEENTRVWSYTGTNFNFYGFPVMGNATSISGNEYTSEERTIGTFASASLDYDNQLFLTVTGRNDIVSTMPRGSRSFFYPSVSLGWEFTKLGLFEKQDIMNYGKVRASFAQVGQAGHYYDSFYSTPGYGGGFYAYTPVSYPLPSGVSAYAPYYVLYDPNLKPQNTSNWETGLDMAFFNGRLKAEYTYSYQNVKDQIFSVPCDPTSGYQYMMTNAGRMKTNAHELSISGDIVSTKNWTVSLGANWTKIKNEVVELAEGVESIMLGGFVEPQVRAQAGCTYPNIYGYAFQRDEATGKLLLINGLPQATSESVNLGNCSPDWTMGINFGVRYKRLSLETTWSWQNGGKMYHGTNMTMNYFGATKESLPFHEGTMVVDGIDVATGKQNEVEVSKQDYYMAYYDVTESGIYNTSFFKLRDCTLTYNLPKVWGMDLSVYAFARNVLIWADMPNFDPESSQGTGNMSGYFERFSVPATSSFGGGLKVQF